MHLSLWLVEHNIGLTLIVPFKDINFNPQFNYDIRNMTELKVKMGEFKSTISMLELVGTMK